MQVKIQWKAQWIYSADGTRVSTVQKFLSRCQKEFQGKITILKSDLCSCEFSLDVEGDPKGKLRKLLEEFVGSQDFELICTLSVNGKEQPWGDAPAKGSDSEDDDGDIDDLSDDLPPEELLARLERIRKRFEEEMASMGLSEEDFEDDEDGDESDESDDFDGLFADEEPEKAKAPKKSPEKPAEEKKKSVMEKIDALFGAEKFKALCHEISDRVDRAQKHKTNGVIFSTAYVFFIDRNYNFEKYSNLLVDLFVEKGLFSDSKVRFKEIELPNPTTLGKSDISEIESEARRIREGFGSRAVVTIDIADWAKHTNSRHFKKILQAVQGCEEPEHLFLFRCDLISEEARERVLADFRDVLLTKSVSIRYLTDAELQKMAELQLKEYGYKLSDPAKKLFLEKLELERDDGFFYGEQTVEKIVNEMVDAHETSENSDSDEISDSDIKRVMKAPTRENDAQDMLEKLYGMEDVKRQIVDVCNQIAFAREHGIKLPCVHMKFVGNPGTGKTTMARIVGLLLKESGTLRIGNFFEHHARDLCGQYVGHTAVITKDICTQAYGSVLFIDEAYALFRSRDNGKDFGQEAIDTLIAEMENHSEDMLVIFAGYPEEMELFTEANPGLKSRIPFTIQFPNYSADELYHIFERMATREFNCSKEFLKAAKEHFTELAEKVKDDRSFGNARYVRNLYERTWGNAAKRAAAERNDGDVLLQPVDLKNAVAELTPKEKPANNGQPPKVGFL